MPRFLRLRRSSHFYEIVLRGNRREPLFSTAEDRRALNRIAIQSLRRFHATLHAYCLMPNHFRALLQIDGRVIGKALRTLAIHYARYRQRDSQSAGNLFEPPYEARRIESRQEFLRVLRGIHLMPVTANIAVEPKDYRWSSHRAYLGYKSVAKISTNFGLSLLDRNPTQARAIYQRLIADGLEDAAIANSNESSDDHFTQVDSATGDQNA